MSRWFRLYDDTLNDPKILKLSDKTYRIWIGILCLASKNNGWLPDFEDMALLLRIKPEKFRLELEKLIKAGLIDHDDSGLTPHNWKGRQFKSDVSTERVKRFRNARRKVSETPPDTETDTDTDKKKEEPHADARGENVSHETSPSEPLESPKRLPRKYAFEGTVIRLTEADYRDWENAFKRLDLRAELVARDAWLATAGGRDRERWFISTPKYLANRNAEARSKNQNFKWSSGIEGVY